MNSDNAVRYIRLPKNPADAQATLAEFADSLKDEADDKPAGKETQA